MNHSSANKSDNIPLAENCIHDAQNERFMVANEGTRDCDCTCNKIAFCKEKMEFFFSGNESISMSLDYRYSDSEGDEQICVINENCNISYKYDGRILNNDMYSEEVEDPTVRHAKQFKLKITNWARKFRVFHSMLNGLLEILREFTNIDFSKDSRSLLGTPRTTCIDNMDNGQYCHIGFTVAVEQIIMERLKLNHILNDVNILVNIYGAPIGLSSEKVLWPILCMNEKIRRVKVVGTVEFTVELINLIMSTNT